MTENISTKQQGRSPQKTPNTPELHYLSNALHDLYMCYDKPKAFDIKKHLIQQMRLMLGSIETELVRQQQEERNGRNSRNS